MSHQKTHEIEFQKMFAHLAALYPHAKISEATSPAYWETLQEFPFPAVRSAMRAAPARSPEFFPTAGVLRIWAAEFKTEIANEQEQLLLETSLPAPSNTRETALQEFYKHCDRVNAQNLGENIDESNQHLLQGLIVMLGASYGFTRKKMIGDEKESEPRDRFNYAKTTISPMKRARIDPHSVVRGLRRIPAAFCKYPTFGMIEASIKGESLAGFPAEWKIKAAEGGAQQENQQR